MKKNGHPWNVNSIPSPPQDDDDDDDNNQQQQLLSGSPRSSFKNMATLLARTRDPVLCGRRMFLAALICASKFLQDRTYSNKAWAKISSLPVHEINTNEKVFLDLLEYNLFVDADLFKNCGFT